jgi:hypothetical protein
MVVVLVAGPAFARPPAAAESPQSISALLRAKTESFSRAGQSGDGKTMAAMLDDRVTFINEGGDVATKAAMAASTPTPANGAATKMTVTDWTCEVRGDVAVTSFIDDLQQVVYGQPFHAQFRSVETWQRLRGDWRMVGSATVALQAEPPAVTLTPAVLDDYVGVYEAAPGVDYTFTRRGDELMSSVRKGPQTVQKAEVRDVFFTPGGGRARKVFQRDASGKVVALAIRRDGHDIVFRKVA